MKLFSFGYAIKVSFKLIEISSESITVMSDMSRYCGTFTAAFKNKIPSDQNKMSNCIGVHFRMKSAWVGFFLKKPYPKMV